MRSPRLRRSPPPTKTLALTLTLSRLLLYGGRNPSKPLLLALKGRVLDVSAGAEYYGPEGPYQLMAGKDASYAFAMMSLKAEDAHANLAGTPDMVRRLAWQRPTDREKERDKQGSSPAEAASSGSCASLGRAWRLWAV